MPGRPWRSCTVREIIIDHQLNYLFLSTSAGARAYSGGYLSPRTPLAPYFTARYFGLSSFSELQGYNMAVMTFCYGIAPICSAFSSRVRSPIAASSWGWKLPPRSPWLGISLLPQYRLAAATEGFKLSEQKAACDERSAPHLRELDRIVGVGTRVCHPSPASPG